MRTRRSAVVRGLHSPLTRTDDPTAVDSDLLRRFSRDHDEAAFEAVVSQHGSMVLGVGRRVLGDTHAAEDVCQAAFLLLAKKAGGRGWRASVAPWL